MTADEHARAKTVFFGAMGLSGDERQAFVEQACSGDTHLQQEVMSLLEHHTTQTLLPPPSLSATVQDLAAAELEAAKVQKHEAEPVEERSLVLSELWQENRDVLQRRLFIFAVVLVLILLASLLLSEFNEQPNYPLVQVPCILIVAFSAFMLRRTRQLVLWKLRFWEVVILLSVGLMMVLTDLHELHIMANEDSVVKLCKTYFLNYFSWSFLILIYGVFIPNTPGRAATLLLPLAVMPFFIDQLSKIRDPYIAKALESLGWGAPMPMFAAAVAIFGAKVIHSSRLAAFRARRFAQYELVREAGAGGMGKVYEARHVMLKRPCAIKMIQPERLSDGNLANFEREVRATSLLTHPHTVEVYDYGQTQDGLFFYVMEFLPGVNLREMVSESGPLPPGRALHFVRQICGALEEAHRFGIVHRDIKPANIIVCERGGIYDFSKLLDFGLVRISSQETGRQSGPKKTAGTPAFMSPEQIVDYANIDARADVYSLGALAYFLLVGRPPFVRDNDVQVLLAHANDTATPPNSVRPEISLELSQIVMKCLEKTPSQRYQSASELGQALASCQTVGVWTQQEAIEWWRGWQSLQSS